MPYLMIKVLTNDIISFQQLGPGTQNSQLSEEDHPVWSVHSSWQSATQICEYVNSLKFFCPFTVIMGLLYGISGVGWCTTLVLLVGS